MLLPGIIDRTNEAKVSIESLISRDLLRTTADATLSDVATTMISMASGSMLVFDAQELVGVITLRDIVRAALAEPDITQVRVEEYMTTQPWVVSPGWSARTCRNPILCLIAIFASLLLAREA